MFDPHYRAVAVAVAMWCQITSCSTGAYCPFHMLVSQYWHPPESTVVGYKGGGRCVWLFI